MKPKEPEKAEFSKRNLMYSIMTVECQEGLQISLDSDFTADYKEYVLGLEATKFSMNSSSLSSSSDHQKYNKF